MTLALSVLVFFLSGISPQAPEPTIESLRAKAQERMRQDLSVYSKQELQALEELYQSANKNLGGPDAKEILERVVKQYPKSNRAGSAVLYLAQLTTGSEREGYLKTAIESYGDTWYGDGVQVGAFARAQLAMYCSTHGRTDEAKVLAKEVAERFPGAVDHGGRRLVELLRRLNLL